MSRDRSNGMGSVYKRKSDGRWVAAMKLPNGKRKVFYGRREADVVDQLKKAHAALDSGTLITARRQTMKAFLEGWLEQSVRPRVRPSTYETYEHDVRLHLVPALGHIPLDRLTPAHVQELLNAKAKSGLARPSRGDRQLSARSVAKIRATLRTALNQAVKWQLVARNVAELVDPPKVERHEIEPFTPVEARTFLSVVKDDRLEALYSVALTMGLRAGEALGLRWQDVDLEAGELRVQHQLQRVEGKLRLVPTKTAKSRRTLAIPAEILPTLQAHRERQLFERRAAASSWKGPEPKDDLACFVFTTPIGTPLENTNLTKLFQRTLERAGLRRIRFHDLRHSCASLLLAQGVPARVVMEILGHSQISLTMNTYSHVVPELQREAAAKMGAALFG